MERVDGVSTGDMGKHEDNDHVLSMEEEEMLARLTGPNARRWSQFDPSAPSTEQLQRLANKVEKRRLHELRLSDPEAARKVEEHQAEQQREIREYLKTKPLKAPRETEATRTHRVKLPPARSDMTPEEAKAEFNAQRRQEIEAFQATKKGAKFGIGTEVQCDACKKFHLTIQRCGRCKIAWYCTLACQKEDWPTHKFVCAEEEKKRKQQEVSGIKKPEGAPKVKEPLVAPSDGESYDKSASETVSIQALDAAQEEPKKSVPEAQTALTEDKKKKGKEKKRQAKPEVEKNPQIANPALLEPDVQAMEEVQEEMLGRKINRLHQKRWRAKERSAWDSMITEEQKDVLESMWRAFNIAGLVLLTDENNEKKLTVREMFKFSGSKVEFVWLAKKGKEWVGRYTKEPSALDAEIALWLKEYMKQEGFKLDPQGKMDYDTFIRMVCARAADYRRGQ